jgi:hypothetical protein
MTDLKNAYGECNNLSGIRHNMNCYCGAHPHAMMRTQGHVEKESDVDPRFYNPEYHIRDMPFFHNKKYNRVCGPHRMTVDDGKNVYYTIVKAHNE